jgi:hypothetical protein
MTESRSMNPARAKLLGIALVSVPILVVCYFVSGLQDQRADPRQMTTGAIAARLQPVAHADVGIAPQAKN